MVNAKNHIKQVDFTDTFRMNYHDYGKDVIKNRALPDVRDGLKPVHRAILVEMLTSHNTSKNKTVKVARITGAVIGKWHPHGDSAVEDALVGLALPWRNSMPAIEIKGNKGSVFGDTHAAGRYIEARLTPTGDAYGKDLREGIVEYEPNFDETKMMPKVLPAQLPYLLINGDEGIGVGFASNIPTHNPIEVINTFIRYVQHPTLSIDKLMETMPGPDFDTKGEIINKSELPEIYKTGYGHIRVRGRVRYDKKQHTLHIYEIPSTAAGAMDKLVDEITQASMETLDKRGKKHPAKIAGINSVANHSGKDGIDIAIRLKRGTDPEQIKNNLFAKTRLETTAKFDFSALNNKQLKHYNLASYFKDYLAFQHYIVINEFTLKKAADEKRMEIIRGLLILQKIIDEVVDCARNANGKDELREVLMTGKILDGVKKSHEKIIKTFKFSELQAEHIANLPIYKINKLDYAGLVEEGKNLQSEITEAEKLMEDPKERKKLIIKRHKEELKKLDPDDFSRKTDIIDDTFATASTLEIPETPLYVSFDKYNYVRVEEKRFDGASETTNKNRLGFFDGHGICWNLHLCDTKATTKNGTLVNQMVDTSEQMVGWTNAINDSDEHYGLFIYADGNAKLTDMRKFLTKSKSTKVASGKTDIPLVKMIDVPTDAVGIKINNQVFKVDQFSVNGMGGRGKRMVKLPDGKDALTMTDPLDITFITDEAELPKTLSKTPSTSASSSAVSDGIAYFNEDGTLDFDWESETVDENHKAVFGIPYPELLKTELLVVHTDGRAKRVNGSQFKVSTHRQQIQADKKGCHVLYIQPVVKSVVAKYDDGFAKHVETELISEQGKSGGGVKAFVSDKHKLVSIEDGEDSTLPLVTLATQPKPAE